MVCAEGAGTAARMERTLKDEGVAGFDMVVQPLERGFILPSIKLAVLAESDVTGRRRAHFQARSSWPTGRALIGSPLWKRRRSSARAAALA